MGAGRADDALRFAARTCRDPARAASRWRAITGGKAIGCYPPLVPEEIIHAAGMLPVTVRGDEYGGSSARWSVLDGWVICPLPHLHPAHPIFPAEPPPGRPRFQIRFCPRRMKVPSMEETLDQVEMLREWGGGVSGRPVSDGALSKSICAYNENRKLLSGLEERAASHPGGYTALEFFRLIRSAGALPREVHTLLLRAALSRRTAPVRRARARVFLGGGAIPFSLVKAIDRARGVLVGDDLEEGHRYNEAVADESGDPALALSRRLRARLLGLEEGEASRAVRLMDRVEASGADRLLYAGNGAFCSSEDDRAISSEAGRRGIPFLFLEPDAETGFSRLDEDRIASFITNGGQGG